MSSNLLRYQCGVECAVCLSMQPDDDSCENTVLLEDSGKCGSIRTCDVDTVTDDTRAQVKDVTVDMQLLLRGLCRFRKTKV